MDEKEFVKKVGLNIKALRVKKEFKQRDLADFAQLNIDSVGKIERGEQNFTIYSLLAIAKVLNVHPKNLLDI
ncbi:MAG: helix-turn-helix transcriptional regulator [Candidatus Gastranaerophilales bacterium]|nr:helix-turn-helix transcriptional regulator [Candidatus Gastranaerophilales bacterium]